MNIRFLAITTLSLAFSYFAEAHPIEGTWKFKSMFCSSHPESAITLKPVPFSDFSPDFSLSFKVKENARVSSQTSELTQKVTAIKALSTHSCTNPKVQSVPGTFFSQEYLQELHYFIGQEEVGSLTGLSLGLASQNTNEPVSAGDCDGMLGFMQFLFGNSHIEGELQRIYNFKTEANKLTLSYKDTLVGSQCESDEDTILEFDRILE